MQHIRTIAALAGSTLVLAMLTTPAVAAAAAPDSCRLPGGVIDASDLAGRSAVECGAVGRLVDAGDGVSLPVPPAGSSVILGLLRPDGQHTYTLATSATGRISVEVRAALSRDPAPVTATAQATGQRRGGGDEVFPDTPGVPGPCERDTFALAGFKWYKPWLFRTTVGTALATEDQSDFDAAARRATTNITRGRNTCGLRGGISAVGAFVGHTTARGNFAYVGDQTTCTAPDHRNVLDEGDLPGGFLEATLAAYCVWTETRHGVTRAVSADLRFNDGDYNWTYDPSGPSCDPAFPPDPERWRYDVESVLTHEVGHVFGLVNLSSDEDINLTMYPGVRRCSGHFRSLGLGDVLGMRTLY